MNYLPGEYWKTRINDAPHNVNGFNGTWNISAHQNIPSPVRNYLSEYFYSYTKLSRVPMDEINKALNEVWEGPGSMELLIKKTEELIKERLDKAIVNNKIIKDDD